MTTISVRITDSERAELAKYGRVSDVIRNAIKLYLETNRSRAVFNRLRKLQTSDRVKTTQLEDLSLIKDDRARRQ
jgi:Arc/MetJ-type ribon-helix-helix transcriptional regulator